MISLLLRLKRNIRHILKTATQWTCRLFAILGFVCTFVELDNMWNDKTDIICRFVISCIAVVAIWSFLFIASAIYYSIKRRYLVFKAGTNNHVYAQYADIFSERVIHDKKRRRNIVIPVNRCFDVNVDDDLISSNTLHGKAIRLLLKSNEYTEATLFPFIDSHNKNYNVRDGSDWEKTLKPRLHERLDNSKNIILVLSLITCNSRALREEIDYGINTCELPVIVIYSEYSEKSDIAGDAGIKKRIQGLWDQLPIFRDSMYSVPTLHVPNKKDLIRAALKDKDYMVNTKRKNGTYYYKL